MPLSRVVISRASRIPLAMVDGSDDTPPESVTLCPLCEHKALTLNRSTCRWCCRNCRASVLSTEREVVVPKRVWPELEHLIGRSGIRIVVAPSTVKRILYAASSDLQQFLWHAHPRSKRLPVSFQLMNEDGTIATSTNEKKVSERICRLAPEIRELESSKRKLRRVAAGGILGRKSRRIK